ncbi:MAG: hypothetical protein RIC19_24645 [Phaeodactylibacter sp.]|uniref:hypothetical protein n=1 Tax=Phaeodactylibacter sp. TaxID=1940289 RepID=UPI0032EF1B3B
MKYLLFFSLFVVWACQTPKTSIPTSALPVLDSAFVASHTHYFQLTPEGFTGEGAQTLEQAVQAAQILVLGETHGSPTLSRFVEQLAPMLRTNGFRHFACEIGPHSAQYLEQLTEVPENIPANLAAFYEQYQFKAIADVPMPFFELQEDVAFLKALRREGFSIWGLDQEYFSSVFFLLDWLQSQLEPEDVPTALHQAAVATIREWMIQEDQDDEGFPVFGRILQEPAVQAYFSALEAHSPEAEALLNDLKISWDIYDRYRGGASHGDRVQYIRNNFQKQYDRHGAPKVFVKIGRLHASKVKSGGELDLGELTHRLASEAGQKSTNIAVWNRYYHDEKGEVVDLLETRNRYYSQNLPLILQARKDDFALIDLRPIREAVANGQVAPPESERLQALINGFDYELLLPADYAGTPLVKP